MTSFWDPEPRRGGVGRWIAFAIAVFLLFGASGVFVAFVTGGRLDLGAFGIRLPALAAASGDPATAGSGQPSASADSAAPGSASADPSAAGATPGASTGSGASGEPGSPAPTGATPGPSGSPSASPSASPMGPVVVGGVDPALAARLQRALETARRKLLLPGVSATIIFPDGSTWTGVSGFAVPSKKQPVLAETPFAIASVTKTFTSALILRLAEEGKLRLDDPLSMYVPAYPDAAHISLTMLLRQTSGLQDYFQDPKVDRALNKRKTQVWTPQSVLAFHPAYFQTVVFQPGVGWHYSNTNYLLLGLVAEKAGGAPWATQIRQQFLDPLGLRSITIQGAEPPSAAPAHANAMTSAKGGGVIANDLTDGTNLVPFTSVVTAAWSAGAIAADSRDLAAWARALYGGSVLKPASKRLLLTFDPKIARAYATAYGMGVSKVRFDKRVAYGHTGALAGTRSSIRWFPKEGLAMAALFNRDGLLRGDDVLRYLVRVLYPKPSASPLPSLAP